MTGMLYHTPAEIIAQLIEDLGHATQQGTGTGSAWGEWTVFPMHLPDVPEQAILVKDTTGILFGRMQPTGVKGEHYGVQLLARSSQDPGTPYKKLRQIVYSFNTAVKRNSVTLYDSDNAVDRVYRVNGITQRTPVLGVGNEGRRMFYSVNVTASIELT